MTAIIVYGSLINQEELCQQSPLFARAYPVFVKGYRRVFNQEPSWRKGDDNHRAVLNVIKSDKGGFNGLLIRLQDDSAFHQLDERECGYNRIAIAQAHITPFRPIASMIESGTMLSERTYSEDIFSEQIFIYVGKAEKQNDDILPNKSYLELCLCGANPWGTGFQEQFLQTTYVGGLTLKTFLQETVLS